MKKTIRFAALLVIIFVSACNGGGDNTASVGNTDTTPPIIYNLLPSGSITSGTTSVTMQVSTDENATCRYSSTTTDAYSAMTVFTNTGTTTHTVTIAGLQDGGTYSRYIKCSDSSGNINTSSSLVTWSIATAGTGTATLSWVAPTTNNVGGALTELSGYKIFHCVTTSGSCTNYGSSPYTIVTGTSFIATGLASGNHCFAVKAYNSGGDSDPAPCTGTNCNCKTIP